MQVITESYFQLNATLGSQIVENDLRS